MHPPSLRRRKRPPASALLAFLLARSPTSTLLVFLVASTFLSSFANAQSCPNPLYPNFSNGQCCAPTPAGCTLSAGSVTTAGPTASDPTKNRATCPYSAAGTFTLAIPSSTTLLVDVIGGNGVPGVLLSSAGPGSRISGYINSGTTYASTGMTIMVGAGTSPGALLAGAGGGFSSIGTCATLSSTSTCPQIVAGGGGGGGTLLSTGGRGGFPSTSSPTPLWPASAGTGLGPGAAGASTTMSGVTSGILGAGAGGGGRRGGGAGATVPLVGLGSGGGGTSYSTYPIVTVPTGLQDLGTNTATTGPSVTVSFTADCIAPVVSGRARQKRQEEIKKAEKALLAKLPCPPDQRACPFPSGEWECVEFGELRSCGGCIRDHTGVDCLALPGVGNIQCFQDECVAASCLSGYALTGHGKCLKLLSTSQTQGASPNGKKKKKKKKKKAEGSQTATGAAGQTSTKVAPP